jgi:hypothetical protein
MDAFRGERRMAILRGACAGAVALGLLAGMSQGALAVRRPLDRNGRADDTTNRSQNAHISRGSPYGHTEDAPSHAVRGNTAAMVLGHAPVRRVEHVEHAPRPEARPRPRGGPEERGRHPVRVRHRPRTVVRCQGDDLDQVEDFDNESPDLEHVTRPGQTDRCPSLRGVFGP